MENLLSRSPQGQVVPGVGPQGTSPATLDGSEPAGAHPQLEENMLANFGRTGWKGNKQKRG